MIKTIMQMVIMSLLFLTAPIVAAIAQENAPRVAADPADVNSIDAIISAVYASISGPAGKRRDWDRFRSLFFKDAHLIPYTPGNPDGAVAMPVEAYIKRVDQFFLENGFFEREIGRTMHRYGHIAQVFSAYDSKRTFEDAAPFARGINSIQLLNHDSRWWVVNIYWQAETPDNPIPAEYLP